MASNDEQDSLVHCWICQGESTDDAPHLLETVCLCRGSLGAVHQHCIDEWVLLHKKTNCPSCGEAYRVFTVPNSASGRTGRRFDYDVPRLSDAIKLFRQPTDSTHRPPTTPPPSTPDGASSIAERWLFIMKRMVLPIARRVVWALLLLLWHWVLLPVSYGRMYFHHSQHFWTRDDYVDDSDATAAATNSSSFSFFCSPQATVRRHWLQDYQNGLEVLFVGVAAAATFRCTVTAFARWCAFLSRNEAAPAAAGDNGGEADAWHQRDDSPSAAVFTPLETLDGFLSSLLINAVNWHVQDAADSSLHSPRTSSEETPSTFSRSLDDDISYRRWHALKTHVRSSCIECCTVGTSLYILGLPHGHWAMTGVMVVAAIVWRCVCPPRVVRQPTRRLAETSERRGEARTPWDRGLWYVTYLFDMFFFSVLLPLCGGFVLRFALGPQLLTWPEVLEFMVQGAAPQQGQRYPNAAALSPFAEWLAAQYTGDGGASTSSSFVSRVALVLPYVLFHMPPSELPSVTSVVAHWFVGTVCLMTLVRYESSVMVPLFHPGVDLFFIRSVDISDEMVEEGGGNDFAWRFVLSQVFDADPLRVLIDFGRVLCIETAALTGFVAFPIQTLFYLVSLLLIVVEGPPEHPQVSAVVPQIPLAAAGVVTAVPPPFEAHHHPPYRHRAFGLCVPIPAAPPTMRNDTPHTNTGHPPPHVPSTSANSTFSTEGAAATCPLRHVAFDSRNAHSAHQSWERDVSPHHPLFSTVDLLAVPTNHPPVADAGEDFDLSLTNVLMYVWLLLTLVLALYTFPMQRYQLQYLRPFVHWMGASRIIGLKEFLFDEERLRLVDEFLLNPDQDELLMPVVPPDRMFVRRERFFTSQATRRQRTSNGGEEDDEQQQDGEEALMLAPAFLKLRLLIFSLCFYAVSTVALWAGPIVCGTLAYPALSWFFGHHDDAAIPSLAIIGSSIGMTFCVLDPLMFLKCAVEVPVGFVGLLVVSVVQCVQWVHGWALWWWLSSVARGTPRFWGEFAIFDIQEFMFPPERHVGTLLSSPLQPLVGDDAPS